MEISYHQFVILHIRGHTWYAGVLIAYLENTICRLKNLNGIGKEHPCPEIKLNGRDLMVEMNGNSFREAGYCVYLEVFPQ